MESGGWTIGEDDRVVYAAATRGNTCSMQFNGRYNVQWRRIEKVASLPQVSSAHEATMQELQI